MKILVALSRVPYPLDKGDKLRAYHQIRLLSQRHDVYVVALYDKPVKDSDLKHLSTFCRQLFLLRQNGLRRIFNLFRAFFKGLPLQCGYFYSRRNHRKIDRFIRQVNPDRIYCQLFRMAEYVRHSTITKTIDYQDVFSKGMYRRYEKAPWLLKPFYRMESRRILRYESTIFYDFDHHTIITAIDRDLMPEKHRQHIEVIANGVDFEHFTYKGETKKYDLIFCGNMSYAPNVDAAEYLVKTIFPRLKEDFPDLTLVLCGASPSARVKAMRRDDIIVTGWVDTMAPWYAQSKIFIAPMRLGTGLQNKLLEAMVMQLPCVTSPLAGNPLAGAAAENALIICHNENEYADAVRQLMTQPEYYDKTARNCTAYVRQHYQWEKTVKLLETVLLREPVK